MERISPTVHLTVLTCVLVVNLPIFPLLYRQSLRLHSIFELCRQPQTWIMISNFTFVFPLVILLALVVSKTIPLDNGNFEFCVRHSNWLDWKDTQFWLAIDLLLRLSITCATISEVCLHRNGSNQTLIVDSSSYTCGTFLNLPPTRVLDGSGVVQVLLPP